jgi:hypothetical protein
LNDSLNAFKTFSLTGRFAIEYDNKSTPMNSNSKFFIIVKLMIKNGGESCATFQSAVKISLPVILMKRIIFVLYIKISNTWKFVT